MGNNFVFELDLFSSYLVRRFRKDLQATKFRYFPDATRYFFTPNRYRIFFVFILADFGNQNRNCDRKRNQNRKKKTHLYQWQSKPKWEPQNNFSVSSPVIIIINYSRPRSAESLTNRCSKMYINLKPLRAFTVWQRVKRVPDTTRC